MNAFHFRNQFEPLYLQCLVLENGSLKFCHDNVHGRLGWSVHSGDIV